MYKIGDKVRVTRLVNECDERRLKIGSIHTVMGIREGDEAAFIRVSGNNNYVMLKNQIEKVEESKEMTFPEMVQKLIDGEFEVGTELIVKDQDGDTKTYEVIKNMYGFGLDIEKSIYPSVFNGKWTVKEQPIKEMSIEELQQELGYKIKIVE